MTYTCILCYKEHICNYERNLTKYLIYESIKLCLCVVITCGTNETMDNTKTVSILGRLRQFATVPSRLQFARSGRWCSIARDYFSILWAPFPLLTYGNKTSVHIFTPVNGYTYMAYSLCNSSCHEDS